MIDGVDFAVLDDLVCGIDAEEQAIIIGDTKFDMLGAQETGIQKLAVTWGFGEQADLLNYQPDYMAHKPLEVLEYFQ